MNIDGREELRARVRADETPPSDATVVIRTVVLPSLDTVDALAAALGRLRPNPYAEACEEEP